MALFGDTATLSQTGSTVTGEAIAGVLQGRYYPLAKRQVSLVTVTGRRRDRPTSRATTTRSTR